MVFTTITAVISAILFPFTNAQLSSTSCSDLLECYGADIVDDADRSRVLCDGHRACQTGSFEMTERVWSRGMFGISQVTDVSVGETIQSGSYVQVISCWGEASCYEINGWIGGYRMDCHGLNSCYGIESSSSSDWNMIAIRAYGMFSLQNSVIYSYNGADGEDTFDVSLYGYFSGYGSTIICQSGHSCSITCYSNSCKYLTFTCDDSVSTCNIDCDESSGHTCPNSGSTSGASLVDYNLEDSLAVIEIWADEDDYYNYITRQYQKYTTSNTYYDISLDDLEDTDIGCSTSCADYDTTDGDCYNTDIALTDSTESLCCRGYYSCLYSSITVTDMVDEYYTIYCQGYWGCGRGTLTISNSNNINVECSGTRGCSKSSLTGFNSVVCNGVHSCFDSSFDSVEYVGCFGYAACSYMDATDVKYIYATSYDAVGGSVVVDNSNLSEFYIYFMGYDSVGSSFELTCDDSILNECIIYCYNDDSCMDLNEDNISCSCQIVVLTDEM